MLGPTAFNTIGILLGFPLRSPFKIRPIFIVVVGVMLGSGFTSEFLNQPFLIASSILLLFVNLIISTLCVVPYYRYVGKFDHVILFFWYAWWIK